MKLSEAILRGDSLKKPEPDFWLTNDGSCGCALGGALLATGVTQKEFDTGWKSIITEMDCVRSRWPWLTAHHAGIISILYDGVVKGEKTIEDVAAYVRSVEPAEPQEAEAAELERILCL